MAIVKTVNFSSYILINKKFALCIWITPFGDNCTQILDHDEYCTIMCTINVLFESDNINEVINYNNKKSI